VVLTVHQRLSTGEQLDLLADCAERAERLRRRRNEVVLVTGAELSLFTVGFLPGASLDDRLGLLTAPHPRRRELLAEVPARINDFLGKAVALVRERFGGKVSYASVPFEGVDWTPFDVVSVDAYRTIEIADRYRVRGGQGARGPPRRGLPRHGVGTQGRVHRARRLLPRLTGRHRWVARGAHPDRRIGRPAPSSPW
jgi:hypothetical protein